MARRWELTEEEWARVRAVREQHMRPAGVLQLLARSPRLIPEIASTVARSALEGVWSSNALVWVLDSERVRQEVPDAARGIGFTDEQPFLGMLEEHLRPHVRALEVGAGDGRVGRHVADRVGHLTCADVSPTMVREARENLGALANVAVVQTRGASLDTFPDASFDLAFAQGVLAYLDVNVATALVDEMHRVLRPGGICVVNAHTIDQPAAGREQLLELRRARARNRFTAGLPRAYCERQLEAMLRLVGFEVVRAGYGDEPESSQLPYIVVGRRAGGPTAAG